MLPAVLLVVLSGLQCVPVAWLPAVLRVVLSGLRVSAWPGRWLLLCPPEPSPSLLLLLRRNTRHAVLPAAALVLA